MRYTQDNTSGYTEAALVTLNAEFDRIVGEWVAAGWDMSDDDWMAKSRRDYIAEFVLMQFDIATA